eukprot:TRINITY_DN80391_c0_g1_i1.p1 TRINITY_DN80391_c0_g1~~TRINITY_DN80391_c0_g1_i1.p1  ORF type:complete len:149 (-),score=33.47 TRINITY_DN80391_c0_g1_i1:116-562(-)
MGWFGGTPESGSSGGGDTLDLSKFNSSGDFGSKMRSSSSYTSGEFDSSHDASSLSSASSFSPSAAGGSGSASELQQMVALEQQKLQFMQQVHKLNDVCWETCVGSPSSSLSGREETCLTNCVERFVDTSVFLVNRFAQLTQRMAGGMR